MSIGFQHTEELCRTLFAETGDGIFISDTQGRFLEANLQGCILLGYSQEELRQLSWSDLLSSEDRTQELLTWEEGNEDQPAWIEDQIRHKEGRWFAVEIRLRRLAEGHLVAFVRDITERKQAEAALRRSEHKFATAFRISPDSINLNRLNDGLYLDINEGFTRLTGYSREEVIGRSSLELNLWADPADRARLVQGLRERGQVENLEAKFRLKDGTLRTGLMSARLIEVEDEACILSITRDITERKQMEVALQESEERFRLFMDNSPTNVWIKDEQGRCVYLNQSHENLLGVRLEEWRGKTNFEVWPPEVAEQLWQNDQQVLAASRRMEFTEQIPIPDGSQSYWWTFKFPFQDTSGQRYVAGISVDITERKRVEAALLASENNYRLLSEFNCQLNDISIEFNEAASVDELWRTIAGTYRRLTGAISAIVFQYEQPTGTIRLTAAAMDEGLLNRIEVALGSSLFEIRIIVPDEMIPLMINRNINRTADLVALAFGQISPETADWLVATLGYTQVIVLSLNYGTQLLGTIVAFMAEEQTDGFDHGLKTFAYMAGLALTRKKAEEALQRSEQLFRALIENSADAIALLNAEGVILYESPAVTHILGYQPEDMLGRRAFEFLHPDDQITAGELFGQILRQPQQPVFGQFRYGHKDGTWHWVEATGTNLLDTPGIQAIVVNYSDITARRQAEEAQVKLEERLRQAQKMESIGLLAGGVAHDFNNLLTVILGYSDLIQAKLPPHDPLFDKVEQIRQSGKRAESLVRQLLAFSRKQMLTPIVLDLNDLITNLEKILGRLIGEDTTLDTSLQADLWTVTADPGQMEQVIINLAANARDAMPTGGRLTLETRNISSEESQTKPQLELSPGPYVRLRMTDTGHGMDEATLTHIFEPFFTTKEQGKGTGLGLATVYGIIKQSGGEITVNSQPGRGTTFEIYLPAHETTSSSPVSPQPEPVANRGRETILLVEDEQMVRDVVRLALQSYGYKLLEADHGYQALALAQQQTEPIDLLLTDVVMPQMSGSELAERLKMLHPQIKALFMSGYTDDEIIRHGLETAAIEFLSKPFSPATLAVKVREMLDR